MLSGGLRTENIIKISQEKEPIVTVVTVVRNGGKTLEETIQSVINQTYTNIEYIIIDGASTDNTLNIISNYDEKLDFWISEPDKGIYHAMNKGIDLATGEWINFMNSGDSFYDIGSVEKFIKLHDAQSDVVYGNSQFFFDFGVFINNCTIIKQDYMPNCHQSFFVKTNLLRNKYFDIKYQICADKKFFYEIYKLGYKYQHIPVVVCNYELINGFSALTKNKKTLFLETAEIEGTNKSLKGKIDYLLFMLKIYIIKVMPRKIMRENFKKKYQLVSY